MNNKLSLAMLALLCQILVVSCGRSDKDLNTISASFDSSNVQIIDFDKVEDKETVNLSDLIEGLDVVRMDNSNDALFKKDWVYLSDNFIAVRDGASSRPAKLFDKHGRYIAPIGSIGRGPGEYTSVYDILIDEPTNSIFLSQVAGRVINQYDLKGQFIREIKLGANLNKARLFNNGDSTISIVNLCFNDNRNAFVAAKINPYTEETEMLTCPELGTNFEDESGAGVGFNNEVYSFRNSVGNSFDYSYINKLLTYDPDNGIITSTLEVELPDNLAEDHSCIFNDLPEYTIVHVIGSKGKTIKVSKDDDSCKEFSIVNDFWGGFDSGMSFQDGYYFKLYEPRQLKTRVNEFLKTTSVDDATADYLKSIINSMDDDDNNVLLIGKLKCPSPNK